MSLLYIYPFVCRLLAPLCWSRHCSIWTYKYTCSDCNETLFLVTGTTDFVIKPCSTMCYCCPIASLLETVTWYDEHGHKGDVAGNYMVSTLTPFPIYTCLAMAYTYGVILWLLCHKLYSSTCDVNI